ncbi:MAG: C1 family peptidase [Actinobacteria bacterium]|nr:C1 family peptidase [Actinomycetota bacterium]
MSSSVDITSTLGPARDQGKRGTCLAFSTTAAHEVAIRNDNDSPGEQLGEELLHWRSKQIDSDGGEGASPTAVSQALEDPGQSAGDLWPYDPDRDQGSPTYKPPASALDPERMRRAVLSEIPAELESIRGQLCRGTAVILGLTLWRSFFKPRDGEIDSPAPFDLLPGALHAVTVVGFRLDDQSLLIRNSWGRGWGLDGHARIQSSALAEAAVGAWIVRTLNE